MLLEGIVILGATLLAKKAVNKLSDSKKNHRETNYSSEQVSSSSKEKNQIDSYSIDPNCCINCGSCEAECPVSAISEEDEYRVIDPYQCITCGACVSECPTEAIHEEYIDYHNYSSDDCYKSTVDQKDSADDINEESESNRISRNEIIMNQNNFDSFFNRYKKKEWKTFCCDCHWNGYECLNKKELQKFVYDNIFTSDQKDSADDINEESESNRISRNEIIMNQNNFDSFFNRYKKKEWQTFCCDCHWNGYECLNKKELQKFVYDNIFTSDEEIIHNSTISVCPICLYPIDDTMESCPNCRVKFER